jgi:tetratricopeptide (TPR) repeat protein
MGCDEKYDFEYVIVLASALGLEGKNKAIANSNAGIAANYIGKLKEAEEQYKKAIELDPKDADAHYNYAHFLDELERNIEAEEHYKKAIKLNSIDADTHNNYALLLVKFNRKTEAEEHYKKAIEIYPKYVRAHINYARLLVDLNRRTEAEEYYKKTIELNPKYDDANTYNNCAILLDDLGRKTEAEEQYKKTIELYPKNAEVHFNYAILLEELNRKPEAEGHYKKAIELNPKYVKAHNNYALLLQGLNRKSEAEELYQKAIEIDPKYANAHGNYALLLIEYDKRKESWKETEIFSNFCKETGRVVDSHLAKAWLYQEFSEKNFKRKRFGESSKDANEAGEEYLNAARTSEGFLKDNLTMQGNVLKAKSYVRKIPEKSWYKKIFYRFGKNPDIPELMENLKNAAIYYEKASLCPIGERKDVCNACSYSMNVFSETLNAMSAFMKGDDAEINIRKWSYSLEQAYKIYSEKNLKKGVDLVETLKQLIKCVDELAEHRKMGLHIQEERLGKCYNNLLEVSEKLDGALKVIAEHSVEAIRDYSRKQGMGFIGEETKKSFLGEWIKEIRAAAAVIIAAAAIDLIFSLNLYSKLISLIKSLITGLGNQ